MSNTLAYAPVDFGESPSSPPLPLGPDISGGSSKQQKAASSSSRGSHHHHRPQQPSSSHHGSTARAAEIEGFARHVFEDKRDQHGGLPGPATFLPMPPPQHRIPTSPHVEQYTLASELKNMMPYIFVLFMLIVVGMLYDIRTSTLEMVTLMRVATSRAR